MFRALLFLATLLAPSVGLAADPISPDPKLTPGEWRAPPTPLRTLCAVGYTKTVRNVPASVETEVFRRYGYDRRTVKRGDYEVDHLVSLELDGTNGVRNLWPETYLGAQGARRKDVLEHALHRAVCSGKMPLRKAQEWIARDWQDAWNYFFRGHPTTKAGIRVSSTGTGPRP